MAREASGATGVLASGRPCFLAIVSHVVGILVAPLLLAVKALLPIRRVSLELLPVILSPPSTLTFTPTENNLVRMIVRGLEQLSTIRAAGKRHVH
jgi:hypothetical protein